MRPLDTTDRRALVTLVAVALLLRLALVAVLPPTLWLAGSDGPWYVRVGWGLSHGRLVDPMRTVGPLYPLVLAAAWRLFPTHPDPVAVPDIAAGYLLVVRVLQAGLGAMTVAVVFAVARTLASPRAARIGAAAVAVSPAFVLEPFYLRTETLFLLLLTSAVWCLPRAARTPAAGSAALAGLVAAAAALVRPALLPFLLVASACLVVVTRRRHGVALAGVYLAVACATLLPWHLWLFAQSGSPWPEGLGANLWIGAQQRGAPLDRTSFHAAADDLARRGESYGAAAHAMIAGDPVGWLARRARNLSAALAQPHGTSDLGGPSAKAAVAAWVSTDRTLAGAIRLATPGMALRVTIYLFHYGALALAALGAWRARRRWRSWLPVAAAILSVTLVYAVLVATPRYLFPLQPFFWILAAAAVTRDPDSRRPHRVE